MPVVAGVIAIDLPAARGALGKLAPTRSRPTRDEIAQDARLAGEQTSSQRGARGAPVAADDVRHFEHETLGGDQQRPSTRCVSGSVRVSRTSCVRCV
jgi:hypothetical protein